MRLQAVCIDIVYLPGEEFFAAWPGEQMLGLVEMTAEHDSSLPFLPGASTWKLHTYLGRK
jgi:hypothetical protein